MRRRATFKPLSFEQWQDMLLADPSLCPTKIYCRSCDGSGESECCSCGHERECEDCDGWGQLEWAHLTENQRRLELTQAMYAEAVIRDAEAWARYLGGEPAEDLASAGFRVWTELPTRTLRAATNAQGVHQ